MGEANPAVPRGAEVFRSERYQKRGSHLGRIPDVTFNRTAVDDAIERVNRDRQYDKPHPLAEGRLGDPTRYEGLQSYSGYGRHLRRYIYFHRSHEFNGYDPSGDESFKTSLRKGRWRAEGYIPVPPYIEVYITPGVAGALRLVSEALLLPPYNFPELPHREKMAELLDSALRNCGEKGETPQRLAELLGTVRARFERGMVRDNVVMPMWTYVSHLAETFRSHGDVKICGIAPDGQIDIGSLKSGIDRNTRAVLFATVGNPLTVAMEPSVFGSILDVTKAKMAEFGHPILVIADIVYEYFRRDRSKRIDAIQETLKRGGDVPVIEMSSFSKMMAIPGQRVGYCRILWKPDLFPKERADFLNVMKWLYQPTLGPVARHIQRALGDLLTSIASHDPVEEELAPIAAVMAAMKELGEKKDISSFHLLFRPQVVQETLSNMGVPEGYFSASCIACRARDIANAELGGYGVDVKSEKVDYIATRLVEAGLARVVKGTNFLGREIRFYQLAVGIPEVKKDPDGQLELYGISKSREWRMIAAACRVRTEDACYQEYKDMMRGVVFERVLHFAKKLDDMRPEGVYLHPAYYGGDGALDPNRLNSFYVLWGFEKLRSHDPEMPQAARIVELCVENSRPILASVPAEVFIPFELRGRDTSYVRTVALQPVAEMDEMLETIRIIARELRDMPFPPSGAQLKLPL